MLIIPSIITLMVDFLGRIVRQGFRIVDIHITQMRWKVVQGHVSTTQMLGVRTHTINIIWFLFLFLTDLLSAQHRN